MSPHYRTAQAFKTALEERLKTPGPRDLARQRLIYERFAVRLVEVLSDTMILKGGFMLELRLTQRRTTRDIDLGWEGDEAALLGQLQRAGRLDKGDFLLFEVEFVSDLNIAGLGGKRFRVSPQLAGKTYGNIFKLDVAFSRGLGGIAPELVMGSSTLDFMELDRPTFQAYPLPLHLGEKLMAYVIPRADGRVNSRVRDLPDIALIGTLNTYPASRLLQALLYCLDTYNSRHDPLPRAFLPTTLPPPNPAWTQDYTRLVEEFELIWPDLTSVHQAAAAFIDPVLAGVEGTWNPATWTWS